MEFYGKLTHKYPAIDLETKKGMKKKMVFVIKQPGEWGDHLAFETMNDAVISFMADTSIGTELKIVGGARSREYQDRWYTNLSAGIVEVEKAKKSEEVPFGQPSRITAAGQENILASQPASVASDDLPF